jgi:hypothetical protein
MVLTAEQFLSNLPIAIIAWTAVTLCWGIYVHVVNNKMMEYSDTYLGGRRAYDQYNTYFIILANGILGSFLLLEHLFVDFLDMILVINIFYNVYLASISYNLCRWWRSRRDNP